MEFFRSDWLYAFAGGALIGLAASIMLLLNGRVMGVSGILYRAMSRSEGPNSWRYASLAGLLAGGICLRIFRPEAFSNTTSNSNFLIASAGLLVGFGAVLGSGCTSGHGVCGISRLSFRSFVATCIFIMFGAAMVFVLRASGVRP